jgi:hypothetical protein
MVADGAAPRGAIGPDHSAGSLRRIWSSCWVGAEMAMLSRPGRRPTFVLRVGYPAPMTSGKPGRKASTAVVVVHGIGSQKPGGPLRSVSQPLEEVLSSQGSRPIKVKRVHEKSSGLDLIEFLYDTTLKGRRTKARVLMMESYWANPGHRPGLFRTIGWFIKCLPLLIILLLAPGHGDFDVNKGSAAALVYRFVLPLLFLLCLLQQSTWIWTAGAALVLIAVSGIRNANILGDVYMAAVDDAEVAKILKHINSVIDRASAEAARVVVVAHSQGGYLSHRSLNARLESQALPTKIELVGVGSGLKPIWILKKFGNVRSSLLAWLILMAAGMILISVLPIPFEFVQYNRSFLQEWVPKAVQSMVESQGAVIQRAAPRPVLWDTHNLLVGVPDRMQVSLFLLGLCLFILIRLLAKSRLKQLETAELVCPSVVDNWCEITSSDDSVGRLSSPRLQGAMEGGTPGRGTPLLDHISYYRKTSPVIWYLAYALFPTVVGSVTPVFKQWAEYLDLRVARARAFAAALALLALSMYVVLSLDPDRRGISNLTAPVDHPVLLLACVLVLATLPTIIAGIDWRRLIRAMEVRPIPPPPVIRRPRAGLRLGLATGGFWIAALFAQTSSQFPVQLEGMDFQHRAMFSVAPYALAVGLYCIGAAVAVGYSFSRRGWFLVIFSVLVLAAFLPGHTGLFSFYMTVVTLAFIAISIVNQTTERPAPSTIGS